MAGHYMALSRERFPWYKVSIKLFFPLSTALQSLDVSEWESGGFISLISHFRVWSELYVERDGGHFSAGEISRECSLVEIKRGLYIFHVYLQTVYYSASFGNWAGGRQAGHNECPPGWWSRLMDKGKKCKSINRPAHLGHHSLNSFPTFLNSTFFCSSPSTIWRVAASMEAVVGGNGIFL